MNLKHLTDKTLLTDTLHLAKQEKKTSLEVLHHLLEIDRRKLYSELKCTSLFDYCVRILGYSEGAAHRRISSARLMGKSPEVKAALEGGEVNLSQVSMMASLLNQENQHTSEEKPKLEINHLLDLTKKTGSTQKLKEEMSAKKTEFVSINFKLTKEEAQEWESLKKEMNLGSNELLLKLVRLKKAEREKKKYHQLQKPSKTQHTIKPQTKTIPAEIKRKIYERSNRKCEKCQSESRLEFHHLTPRSFGGGHEAANLKLLCHNCHSRESFTQGFLVPGKIRPPLWQ